MQPSPLATKNITRTTGEEIVTHITQCNCLETMAHILKYFSHTHIIHYIYIYNYVLNINILERQINQSLLPHKFNKVTFCVCLSKQTNLILQIQYYDTFTRRRKCLWLNVELLKIQPTN